ncbi:MAG: hypothetical protein ABW321_23330 [Polyangiales bacterium]
MSTVIDCYLRSARSLADIERTFRVRLAAKGVDPNLYWLHFETADADAEERGRDEFGFEPTLRVSLQPPRGGGDAELEVAMLETAHALDCDLVAVRTDTPIFAYHAGTVYIPERDRDYYEQQVLPSFPSTVAWTSQLPWLSP